MRRFITNSPWSHEAIQEHLNRSVPDAFNDTGMLIVDDVGILKSGRHSVGVQRQYSGAAGKIDNCQVAVDLILAQPGARSQDQLTWPLAMDLYVPKKWLIGDDLQYERQRVEFPEGLEFRTKHEIALEQIRRARQAGVPHCTIGGDSEYGDDKALRKQLRKWGEAYIVGVAPGSIRVIPEDAPLEDPGQGPNGRLRKKTRFIGEARSGLELVDQNAWQEITWTEGTKGVASASFQAHRVRVVESVQKRWVSDETGWLLLEKRGREVRAYVCWGVDDWSLEKLVLYAHLRWTIEQFHREAKQELALDQFEGRTWKGWNHHTAMVLLAYAFLATLRLQGDRGALPTIPATVKILVIEMAIQHLEREGIPHAEAKRIGPTIIRGFTDW